MSNIDTPTHPCSACSAGYQDHNRSLPVPSLPVEPVIVSKKKKMVTFKPICTMRTHYTSLSTAERRRMYYSKEELKILNLEAHAICTLLQDLPGISNSETLLTMSAERRESMKLGGSSHVSRTDSLRGLELEMYPKRKRNKILAQKSLLKYQEHLKRPSKQVPELDERLISERRSLALAAASAKLSTWSKLVALETARLDALRAYESDYLIPTSPDEPVEITSTPFPFYRRRNKRAANAATVVTEANAATVVTEAGTQKSSRHQQKRRGSGRWIAHGKVGDDAIATQTPQTKKRRIHQSPIAVLEHRMYAPPQA